MHLIALEMAESGLNTGFEASAISYFLRSKVHFFSRKEKNMATDYPKTEEGYNSRAIDFIVQILPTEKLDINDVDEMRRRFTRYLELCTMYDQKVSNMQAYMAIGITRHQASEWTTTKLSNPERTAFIRQVMAVCASYREMLMADGKVNPITGIFWQKNFDGYKDQQELVVTPSQTLGEDVPIQEIEQKYKEKLKEIEKGQK